MYKNIKSDYLISSQKKEDINKDNSNTDYQNAIGKSFVVNDYEISYVLPTMSILGAIIGYYLANQYMPDKAQVGMFTGAIAGAGLGFIFKKPTLKVDKSAIANPVKKEITESNNPIAAGNFYPTQKPESKYENFKDIN